MKIDPSLIIAVLLDEATDEEVHEVEMWRALSLENEAEYRRMARLWDLAGRMDPLAQATPPAPEEITARSRKHTPPRASEVVSSGSPPVGSRPVGGHAVSGPERTGRSRDRFRRWLPVGIGFAAALVVGLGIGIAMEWDDGGSSRSEILMTGADDVATLTLQDETVVHLAPRSRLVFSREGNVREVSLTGRAYFAVMPDPERPFRVHLPGGDVEVLGTRFDVESRDDGMQVAVVDGNVRMEAHGARLEVRASQVGRMSDEGLPAIENVEDVYEIIDWLGQFLAFESTPMHEVVVELQRRFDIHIEIEDDELRQRTVTGWFSEQSPEAMVAAICTVVEARCSTRDGRIRMELSSGARTRGEIGTPVGAPSRVRVPTVSTRQPPHSMTDELS